MTAVEPGVQMVRARGSVSVWCVVDGGTDCAALCDELFRRAADRVNAAGQLLFVSDDETSTILTDTNLHTCRSQQIPASDRQYNSFLLCIDTTKSDIPQAAIVTEQALHPGSRIYHFTQAIDVIIPQSSDITESLQRSIILQLENLKDSTIKFSQQEYSQSNRLNSCKAFHFEVQSSDCRHEIITVCYPELLPESDERLVELRQSLHEEYSVPADNGPAFRRQNALFRDVKFSSQIVFDQCPEVNVGASVGEVVTETVKGRFAYFHYMQDGVNDDGWGCAYRSLQTIWSWFLLQGYTEKPVITHGGIQQTLVDIGDKDASFVGSRKWIGSFEVSYVLDQHLGVTCSFINVQSGDQIRTHASRIANHFRTQRTPIMVGGGVLAHTICGISFPEDSDEVHYLILDPHYVGAEDMKNIKKKGMFSWKPQSFWKTTAYYNLCLPQRPRVI